MGDVRTIIFDFGNVVGFFDHQRAVRRLAERCRVSAAELTNVLHYGELEFAYETGKLTTAEYLAEAARLTGLDHDEVEFATIYGDIFTPNADAAAVVPKLAGRYRLVLASNTNAAHFARFREQFADTLRHFDHLGVSHELGTRKPDPSFFERLHPHALCSPGECLFIDDMANNVAAAQAFGWRTLHYRPGDDLAAGLASHGVRLGS